MPCHANSPDPQALWQRHFFTIIPFLTHRPIGFLRQQAIFKLQDGAWRCPLDLLNTNGAPAIKTSLEDSSLSHTSAFTTLALGTLTSVTTPIKSARCRSIQCVCKVSMFEAGAGMVFCMPTAAPCVSANPRIFVLHSFRLISTENPAKYLLFCWRRKSCAITNLCFTQTSI